MVRLDALERFAGMSDIEVKRIASEIALMGQDGLGYAPSDQSTPSGPSPARSSAACT